MMKKLAIAGLVVGMGFAVPAAAMDHEVVIDHPAGTIAADYAGKVLVQTRQTGSAGAAGRPSTLRCEWTASLNVERNATVGTTLQTRRTMSRGGVANGTTPGWCSTNAKAIDRLVEARRDTFRSAMMAMVEQDRSAILAEADSAPTSGREG
jgi:hypothetical protein